MSAETGPPPQPENYREALMIDAINWLNVVGSYDHEIPKPDTPYSRLDDEVFGYLADRVTQGDLDIALLLATFERQARQATSGSKQESDAEAQNTERTATFYAFARTMNRYAVVFLLNKL